MSRPANGGGPPIAGEQQEAPTPAGERVIQQSRELSRQIADLAERIAESEERVASTFEESARLRPHAEERLRSAAAAARRFAEVERDHSRRMRRVAEDIAGADPASD